MQEWSEMSLRKKFFLKGRTHLRMHWSSTLELVRQGDAVDKLSTVKVDEGSKSPLGLHVCPVRSNSWAKSERRVIGS
jgi:hypothetical protein